MRCPRIERCESTEKGASERCVKRTYRIFWYIVFRDLIIAIVYEVTMNDTSDNVRSFTYIS